LNKSHVLSKNVPQSMTYKNGALSSWNWMRVLEFSPGYVAFTLNCRKRLNGACTKKLQAWCAYSMMANACNTC